MRKHSRLEPAGFSEAYSAGNLHIDYASRMVSVAGDAVQLTPTEYGLLYELTVNAGRVLSHDQLLQAVWGPERRGEHRLLRDVVKRLRRKLGDDADNPTFIRTEQRVGYRMLMGTNATAT